MTIHVDGTMTIRDVVGRCPQTRPVFEAHGIDYCCGGGRRLADAADEQGLELSTLVDALEQSLEAPSGEEAAAGKDWYAEPLAALVDHIERVHHVYVKTALPRLRSLLPTVLKAHGAHHGDILRRVQEVFQALDAELSSHLLKEEQMLFPYIVALEKHAQEGTPAPHACFDSALSDRPDGTRTRKRRRCPGAAPRNHRRVCAAGGCVSDVPGDV
jgi:regulator of cell morphogenesis and NO signaling